MAAPTGNIVFADYNIQGVPSSGKKKVKKSEARAWSAWLESFVTAIGTSGGSIYPTRALLFADLAHAANDAAWVIQDATVAYNGIYRKNGNTGTGSWTRVADLPYSFIEASNSGAGTANAIQADTTIPVSESALVLLNIVATNTASPVTAAFNGGAILTVKSNSGNDIAVGGLPAGMLVMGRVDGATFRLVSDQVSSAIVAAAEAAQAAAEAAALEASDYADLAKDNFIRNSFIGDGITTDFELSIDPGSANNMFVNVGGVWQPISAYTLQHISGDPYLRISGEPVPDDVEIDVRFGSKVDVGTPGDGTVTTAKIGADAVTADKMSAADAVAIRAKIGAAASGTAITNTQMPTGSVVQSILVSDIANTAISATIPRDNTVPQISEGTQILSGSITPNSTTNKIRVRFSGWFEASAILHVIGAICVSTQTDAIGATMVTSSDTAGYGVIMTFEAEYTPGTTSAVTVSIRAGPASTTPGNVRFSSSSGAHFLGAAGKITMVIEEIKA
ncbi:hypothetical protein HFO26_24910 [Rhizobium leguminosarum]|uniref:hypothetical protein n=1 Tax=Rhizobium leguminosarum TaxID=384 RepID=UPI001C95A602|nr:hypothetical protein [Rhizobium leguminosarum]MBY5733495.1 hypothetical protein [Rhizobium leguminosarum]